MRRLSNPDNYDEVHAERFRLSLELLLPRLPQGARVLELGGEGTFTRMLRKTRPDVVVVHVAGDLREAQLETGGGAYDAVLCMEVIEHINDREEPRLVTEWQGSGVAHMLGQVRDNLKPGGLLFLTTPNVASLNTLHKLLSGQPPMVYRPHVREYTCWEIADLLRWAGFELIDGSPFTRESWDMTMTEAQRARLAAIAKAQGMSPYHWGENIFALGRRV